MHGLFSHFYCMAELLPAKWLLTCTGKHAKINRKRFLDSE
ncbi:hypothetical protein BRYFOR_06018 [Marvinbryantia formatexigens DSM 14469]|uniref:Uncharacterized protein n=1 Tax=Marvinbryantia formatexigens DSM 14469 TaxID=478749 RepID=C6LBM3_9FIRM|nr:hypothetical protein BRYFOR_06018 [Marvinbryantia formatexigens DSM 14469]